MEALINEHKRLQDIVSKKTDLIKKDKIDEFQKVLMQERKQIQAINQLEEKRMKTVDTLFREMDLTEDKTVTVLLNHLGEGTLKETLEQKVATLIDCIVQIRDIEQLNRDLIKQSMEFVQLSLEMLQPNMQQINYGQKKSSKQTQQTTVFDSKA